MQRRREGEGPEGGKHEAQQHLESNAEAGHTLQLAVLLGEQAARVVRVLQTYSGQVTLVGKRNVSVD